MFFSNELLSRRESGYGLLWLAATLGSKSKRLPRRSILTADIQQLCTLVSQPPEPLALRLSSNLLVGVVRAFYFHLRCLTQIPTYQRVYKLKHEFFHNEVTNCFTALKKSLKELSSVGDSSLDMAQPNGLREDALNIVVQPGMDMLLDFDVNDIDWDMVFRKAGQEAVIEDFEPSPGAKSSSVAKTTRNLHLLDESHDHLFSASFLNSLSAEAEPGVYDAFLSSTNDTLFDMGGGADPDVGLGEEMIRELEEAWNIKANETEDGADVPMGGSNIFEDIPMDVDPTFVGDTGGGMVFDSDVCGTALQENPGINVEAPISEHEPENVGINPVMPVGEGMMIHTPPPHDKAAARSCASGAQLDEDPENDNVERNTARAITKSRKKRVTVVDPRIELTDEQLKFQRENYPSEMKRLRREIQRKRESREAKRRFEKMLWEPPKDFVAPELIEWYRNRVVYPIKSQEASWKRELEELQNPRKRRRVEKNVTKNLDEELNEGPVHDMKVVVTSQIEDNEFPQVVEMDYMGEMEPFIEQVPAKEGPPSGSHRSSDSPGQPRHRISRPPSPMQSSLIVAGSPLNINKSDSALNSLFPWDRTGPSSSSAVVQGSLGIAVGSSDLGSGSDSAVIRIKRSSRSGSASDSPFGGSKGSQRRSAEDFRMVGAEDSGLNFDANFDDPKFIATQESESMVTLERNSFNFLEYAKMHTVSSSNQALFFSDLVPAESSSVRVAAEGFYHCLALATKDLIRLEQNKPYGPIKIEIK